MPQNNYPEQLRRTVVDAIGERGAERALEAFRTGFRPSGRVNPVLSDFAAVQAAFSAAGHPVTPGALPGSFLMTRDGEYWAKESALAKEGLIYLQSVSSQIPPHVALALAPDALSILDTCAAPGGKTTQLACLFPKAEVVALERDKIRFQKLEFTVRRQQAKNARCFAMDALSPAKWLSGRTYDLVVVDAPCTGSGTANVRNPKHLEVLSKDYDGYAVSRAAIQVKLLEAAFGYVKEGGIVVYSTCSVDPRENEAVLAAVLSKPGRATVPCPENVRAANPAARPGVTSFRGAAYPAQVRDALRVDPTPDGEGFFCAALRRTS